MPVIFRCYNTFYNINPVISLSVHQFANVWCVIIRQTSGGFLILSEDWMPRVTELIWRGMIWIGRKVCVFVCVCVCSQILINKQGSGPGELKRMLVNQSRICRGPSVCVCVGWQASCSPVLFSSVLPVLHNTELLKNAVKLMLFCLPMFSLSLSLPIHLYRFHSFCTTAFYLILSPHH